MKVEIKAMIENCQATMSSISTMVVMGSIMVWVIMEAVMTNDVGSMAIIVVAVRSDIKKATLVEV